jgi:acyl-coenzyme A synthetase/AMP-(fatty) acid ligase
LGEWLRTGDKYYRDAEGFYWYAGRSDDMFKVSGSWVSPAEIEGVLMRHPAVLEVAVVGSKDRDCLVKPKAFVVLRKGSHPNDHIAQELIQSCSSRLAGFKRPRWVEFVSTLPKTATGKIQRFRLREMQMTSPVKGAEG